MASWKIFNGLKEEEVGGALQSQINMISFNYGDFHQH